MKLYKYCIIYVFLFWNILGAQQEYPISAFQCNNTTWFEGAANDSLGLNYIHYGWKGITKTNLLTALNAAQSEGLKIVMNNATKGGSGQDDLAWYCRLYWGSWEAEDSVNFIYWNGDTISDPFANNGMAFVARMASMSETPMLKTCCEHMRQYNSTMTYNVIYHLKIDSLSVDTLANDVPVCSLYMGDWDQISTFNISPPASIIPYISQFMGQGKTRVRPFLYTTY
jgi:hypothetical protein